jgi:hypothetical protein
MTARRSKTTLRAAAGAGRWIVVCLRFDGREKQWQRYDDRAEAEQVAEHLTRIGCPARCTTDDELALAKSAT